MYYKELSAIGCEPWARDRTVKELYYIEIIYFLQIVQATYHELLQAQRDEIIIAEK